jgi:hypothetical protein
MLPYHKKAKGDTIGVVRGSNAKLPHHKGHVPAYLMENEMSFLHQIVKQ